MLSHTGETRERLPGGGAEGQGPHTVVVSEKSPIGHQTQRLVRLSHSQQSRLGGQIPQADHTWTEEHGKKGKVRDKSQDADESGGIK